MINLGTLKNISGAKKYPQGEVIAHGGTRAQMYIVLKGEVGVMAGGAKEKTNIAVLGPGEFFGETAFFLDKDPRLTFTALTDVIVLPIYRHFVSTFIKEEPELCFELMKAMCGRLSDISTAYEKQTGCPWTSPEWIPQEKPSDFTTTETNPDCAPAAQSVPETRSLTLFPEGHGSYTLPFLHTDKAYLMEKSFVCPICKKSFKSLKVKPSKLVTDKTDKDMRIRYQGVEPIYYDIVTCPDCLYSALTEMFEAPDKTSHDLRQALDAVKREVGDWDMTLSPFSVYAGYYLALLCAPQCFYSPHLATAKLLLKLHWIYEDCEDALMAEKTAQQALDAYLNVYQNVNNPPKIDQQLCMIIGELYIKLNDLNNGRNFLFKAQANREGIPLLRTKAADRIVEIREMG